MFVRISLCLNEFTHYLQLNIEARNIKHWYSLRKYDYSRPPVCSYFLQNSKIFSPLTPCCAFILETVSNAKHECKARMQGTNAKHECKARMKTTNEKHECKARMQSTNARRMQSTNAKHECRAQMQITNEDHKCIARMQSTNAEHECRARMHSTNAEHKCKAQMQCKSYIVSLIFTSIACMFVCGHLLP